MTKKIGILLLVLPLLSACTIPVINKEIKLPFGKSSPAEVVKSAQQAAIGLKTFKAEGDFSVRLVGDSSKLSRQFYDKTRKLSLLLDPYQPVVMGIDSYSAQSPMPFAPMGGPSGLEDMEIDLDMTISTLVDKRAENQEKGQTDLVLDLDIGNVVFKVDLETRQNGDKTYFRVNKVPDVLGMLNLDEYTQKWWMVDMGRLEELGEEAPFNISQNPFAGPDYKEKQAEIEAIVNKYLQTESLLIFEEDLGEETINGVDAYHYRTRVNVVLLQKIYKEILEKYSEEIFADDREQGQEMFDLVDKLDRIIEVFAVEIWIGQEDYYPQKSKFRLKADLSQLGEGLLGLSPGMEMDGEVLYSRHNEEFAIEIPEAESLLDLLTVQLQDARQKSRDAKRIADVKQIQTALELYYNDESLYPEELAGITDIYMRSIPQNPTPIGDNCGQESYEYNSSEDREYYSLTYCLEGDTGSIKAGQNIATPAGLNAGNPEKQLLNDDDKDGLNNFEEINIYHSDPENPDTDGDGNSDGDEVRSWYDPAGEGELGDPYSTPYGALIMMQYSVYEMGDYQEFEKRTVVNNEFINDKLGLSLEEFKYLQEAFFTVEHMTQDVDIVNITAMEEISDTEVRIEYSVKGANGKNIASDYAYISKTGDDWKMNLSAMYTEFLDEQPARMYELQRIYSKDSYNKILESKIMDTDQDGLSDFDETYVHRTMVWNEDTDGDGYSDGVEVENGFDPLSD